MAPKVSLDREVPSRAIAPRPLSGSADAESTTRALLREDPELADAIPTAEREHAVRTLRVHVHRLTNGPVDLARLTLPQSTIALLLIHGAMTADTLVGDRTMTEMLIEGDILLPDPPAPTTPASRRRFTVIGPTQVAVLDHRFLLAAARWPALMRAVVNRIGNQQHRLAVHGAICQLPRVEQRIMAILCLLASRTGKVTPDGLLLSQSLSHREIAELIGARRPTVSLALTFLQDLDVVRRRDDGSWLLPHYTGQPIEVESLIPASPPAQGDDRSSSA